MENGKDYERNDDGIDLQTNETEGTRGYDGDFRDEKKSLGYNPTLMHINKSTYQPFEHEFFLNSKTVKITILAFISSSQHFTKTVNHKRVTNLQASACIVQCQCKDCHICNQLKKASEDFSMLKIKKRFSTMITVKQKTLENNCSTKLKQRAET